MKEKGNKVLRSFTVKTLNLRCASVKFKICPTKIRKEHDRYFKTFDVRWSCSANRNSEMPPLPPASKEQKRTEYLDPDYGSVAVIASVFSKIKPCVHLFEQNQKILSESIKMEGE